LLKDAVLEAKDYCRFSPKENLGVPHKNRNPKVGIPDRQEYCEDTNGRKTLSEREISSKRKKYLKFSQEKSE